MLDVHSNNIKKCVNLCTCHQELNSVACWILGGPSPFLLLLSVTKGVEFSRDISIQASLTVKKQTLSLHPKLTDSFFFFSFIYELLERAHLTYQTKTEVHEALEQISGYLAGRQCDFIFDCIVTKCRYTR